MTSTDENDHPGLNKKRKQMIEMMHLSLKMSKLIGSMGLVYLPT